jgi:beta-glucosidase
MQKKSVPLYRDRSRPVAARVDDLVRRMSLDEKISQMVHDAPAIPRLGVPAYTWWNEALHGVGRAGRATVFPQAIGMAASFNDSLLKKVASAISDEARAKHHAAVRGGNRGMYFGLTFWSPNINIFRDPRWGRGQETYGEDPYLTSRMGVAFVKGLQGDDRKYLKLAATPKHYAVHSGPEKIRHTFDATVSGRDLHETYLRAFRACVVEGKAVSVMGAYNRLYGEPCCGHTLLLQRLLREAWGFDGYVVSDCGAIADFHFHHKITSDAAGSSALAVKKGCDLCCGSEYPALRDAVKRGLIGEAEIDTAVKRLFTARFRLGMFDDPRNVPYARIPLSVVDCPEHRRLALRIARESMVLLKNRNNILPLSKNRGALFVMGPNAENGTVLLGSYHGVSRRMVTILEGIASKRDPSASLQHFPGCSLTGPNLMTNPGWMAQPGDTFIAVMGLSPWLEGEENDAVEARGGCDRADIGLPDGQVDLLRALIRARTRVVLVICAGSAITLPPDIAESVDAILYAFYPGEEGGTAVADVLFGDCNPAGRLPFTIVASPGDLPPFDNYDMKGRTYRFLEKTPQFRFGSGLSYTRFSYSNIRLSRKSIRAGETATVSVDIRNSGKRAGDEVVQVYVSDMKASVPVPRLHLEGFRRIHLAPGGKRTVSFMLRFDSLCCYGDSGKAFIEPGGFRIFAGGGQPGARGVSGKETVLRVV